MYSAPELPRLIYHIRRPHNSLIIYKYKPREEIALLIDFCDTNLRLTGFKHYLAAVRVPHTSEKAKSHPMKRLEIIDFGNRHSPPLVLARNLEVEETRKGDKEMERDPAILECSQVYCQ